MSITSKENLLKLINEECQISPALTFNDVDISLPEVVSVDGRDSSVVLTSKIKDDEGSQVEVFYHRRPLPDYIKNNNTFGDEDIASAHDILTAINDRFGLNILPDDVEDTPRSGNAITLTAEPLSHEWRGDVVIQLKPAVQLNSVLTNTQLDGLQYPDHQDALTVGQAYIYSRDTDFSHIKKFLNTLAVGLDLDDTAMAEQVNKCVPELWVSEDAPAAYNFRDATVVFVGEPKDRVGANTAFTNVVSIALSDKCTNFQGVLNLHFNN
ncbi:putative virion structural protein [Erwinia phage Wellington]|jgi:hypothetical protein|uniref:Putative virion structural protein n=1 Tax=Erwinia phage Wellington TaxID=2267653 RepID=A0A345BLG6_9CAUD|nr:virion structural protein [Erwinia phage Wellington]AXF51287.1 putative virion structural protein [Erwinia phage Wellington]